MRIDKDFIPVLVYENGKKVYWYIDISNLSLGKLTELRNELNFSNSVSFIDKAITRNMPTSCNYYNNRKQYRKELKAERETKRKIKYKRRRR